MRLSIGHRHRRGIRSRILLLRGILRLSIGHGWGGSGESIHRDLLLVVAVGANAGDPSKRPEDEDEDDDGHDARSAQSVALAAS